ncbi:MAG: hypothetical protein JWM68_1235 [Verrucomicrobiales bacterium]|nr:hypothetical protein [Verrucomicrobiales bacterium]
MATNIRYGIGAPKEATRDEARKLIDAAYALMLDFQKRGLIQSVGPFLDHPSQMGDKSERPFVTEDRELGGEYCPRVLAEDGWMFEVTIGKGCEVMTIALCRYPAEYKEWDGFVVPTKFRPYYQFSGWVDTEKAVNYNKKNFLHCHTMVIEILVSLEKLGFVMRMEDQDARYWPERSMEKLEAYAKELRSWNKGWSLSTSELLDVAFGKPFPKKKKKAKATAEPVTKTKVKKASVSTSPLFLHQRYKAARSAKQLSEAEKEALRKARSNFGGN